MRRLTLATMLAAPALALAASPAFAADGGGTSSAQATAARVDGVATVSDSQATSDPAGSSAEANSLEVGDQTVAGGRQDGPGTNSGDIVSTGDTPLGSATVGGWNADVDSADNAHADAALAELAGPEGTLHAELLSSEANAGPSGSSSESSGAYLMLGEDLQLYVLHAEKASDSSGSSELASINDQGIGTSDQVDGCEIPGHPLIHIICLAADAEGLHSSSGQPTAAVADVGAAQDQLVAGVILASSQEQAAAPTAPEPSPSAPDVLDDVTTAPVATPSSLPRTGGGLALLPLGASLLGVGEALRRFRNRFA